MKVLVRRRAQQPYQKSMCSTEHITVLLCIRADGKHLPPLVIYMYKKSVPKTNYSEIGPEGAMHKATDSKFINTNIYLEYIQHLDKFIPGKLLVIFNMIAWECSSPAVSNWTFGLNPLGAMFHHSFNLIVLWA